MTTPTDYWNDSCSIQELTYAIENGAVGATTNPTIVLGVLKKEMHLWHNGVKEIIAENPTWSEEKVTWQLIEEMAVKGSELLLPVFERERGLKGRISIQTNPTFYRDTERIVAQAMRFHALAPNMQVKIPVTAAGIPAIEEATYRGVNVNATVSFCVPQALAVGEAIERAEPPRGRGPGNRRHVARLHDHGGPAGRLAARTGEARPRSPRRRGMRTGQASPARTRLQHLQGARLPISCIVGGGLPQSPALVGAHQAAT